MQMRIKILCLAEANEQPLAYRFRLQFAQGIEVSHKAAVPAPPFPLLFSTPFATPLVQFHLHKSEREALRIRNRMRMGIRLRMRERMRMGCSVIGQSEIALIFNKPTQKCKSEAYNADAFARMPSRMRMQTPRALGEKRAKLCDKRARGYTPTPTTSHTHKNTSSRKGQQC